MIVTLSDVKIIVYDKDLMLALSAFFLVILLIVFMVWATKSKTSNNNVPNYEKKEPITIIKDDKGIVIYKIYKMSENAYVVRNVRRDIKVSFTSIDEASKYIDVDKNTFDV